MGCCNLSRPTLHPSTIQKHPNPLTSAKTSEFNPTSRKGQKKLSAYEYGLGNSVKTNISPTKVGTGTLASSLLRNSLIENSKLLEKSVEKFNFNDGGLNQIEEESFSNEKKDTLKDSQKSLKISICKKKSSLSSPLKKKYSGNQMIKKNTNTPEDLRDLGSDIKVVEFSQTTLKYQENVISSNYDSDSWESASSSDENENQREIESSYKRELEIKNQESINLI